MAGTIFDQYLQPVRSIQERMAELDGQDFRREQLTGARQQNALQALAMRRQIEAEDSGRQQQQRFAGYLQQSGGDVNALQKLLSNDPAMFERSQALAKELMQREEIGAKTKQAQAAATKAEVDADKDRLAMARTRADTVLQAVSAARDPASYAQAIQWLGSQGIDTANLPQQYDPKFVQNSGQQAMTIKDRLDQEWKAKGYDLEARKVASTESNNLILPGGAVNQPLLDAKQRVARAGASSVSINTGQKGLDNEFKLRGEFKQEPVYKAHQEMQAAHGQIKQAISQASPAGDLAAATKIMKLLDPGSVVRESELGMAMQASGLMDRVLNYGNMVVTGQKLTPTQRKDFQSLADRLYGESVKAYNSKRGEYEKLGGEYGLNAPRALGPGVSDAAPPTAPAKPVAVIRVDKNGNPVP